MATAADQETSPWWPIVIGTGIALAPIHNQWLTKMATNSRGETWFFLPAFGYLILIMGTGLFLLHNWEAVRRAGWGDGRVLVPLLVIVCAIGLSGLNYRGLSDILAPLFAGVALLALYYASRLLGAKLFLPVMAGAVIASIGVIEHGSVFKGQITGGYVFESNYDIVVGYILLGVALHVNRHQWLLCSLALVAMFLSGSPEGAFSVGVLSAMVLFRRDWGKRLVLAVIPVTLVAAIWFGNGWGQTLYNYAIRIAVAETKAVAPANTPRGSAIGTEAIPSPVVTPDKVSGRAPKLTTPLAISYRLDVIKHAMTNLKPLGEGYILTDFSRVRNVHNVPLVIVQQLGWPGIPAALCWLWVSLWCLLKTKRKYAWVLMLSLGVFDHFTWTQLAPWWWLLVGVSSVETVRSDRVFSHTPSGREHALPSCSVGRLLA